MLLNEHEIDRLTDILGREAPEVAPYARYLSAWVGIVNSNSDGWAYWRAGSNCARKLSELLNQAMSAVLGRGEMPSEGDLKKSLSPIKAAATRFKLPAPELEDAPAATPRM